MILWVRLRASYGILCDIIEGSRVARRLNFNECIPEYVSENMAQYRRPSRQASPARARSQDCRPEGALLPLMQAACRPHAGSVLGPHV